MTKYEYDQRSRAANVGVALSRPGVVTFRSLAWLVGASAISIALSVWWCSSESGARLPVPTNAPAGIAKPATGDSLAIEGALPGLPTVAQGASSPNPSHPMDGGGEGAVAYRRAPPGDESLFVDWDSKAIPSIGVDVVSRVVFRSDANIRDYGLEADALQEKFLATDDALEQQRIYSELLGCLKRAYAEVKFKESASAGVMWCLDEALAWNRKKKPKCPEGYASITYGGDLPRVNGRRISVTVFFRMEPGDIYSQLIVEQGSAASVALETEAARFNQLPEDERRTRINQSAIAKQEIRRVALDKSLPRGIMVSKCLELSARVISSKFKVEEETWTIRVNLR